MRMKNVLMVLMATIMLLALTACGSPATPATEAPADTAAAQESAPQAAESAKPTEAAEPATDEYDPKQVRLAVMTTLRGNPTLQTVQMGFCEKAIELGYEPEIITIDGSDLATLFAAGEAAIADGVDGIVIMRDVAGLEFFETCKNAGVPVIAIHFQIDEKDGVNLMANISCDPPTYGRQCADAMGEELVKRGHTSGTIAITQGGFNTTENNAAAAFRAQIQEKYPQFTVLEPHEEGFDSTTGMQKQAAMIQSISDLIGAFTTTGGGANNWANAATVMGKKDGEICIIGMDYTEANLTLVQNGKVFAVVAQPLIEEAALGAELLDAWFRHGKEPDKYYYQLEAPLVTKDNVDEYWDIVYRVKEMFKNHKY